MISQKKFNALRHSKNFSKLNVEFLIFALSKNIQYIFLVLESLALFGLSTFALRVRYLPNISLMGEWRNFVGHSYNPFWLYYRFLELFFTVTKNMGVYLYDTVRHNIVPGLIICFLIVGIWLAYAGMSHGYSKRESRKHNEFWTKLKNALFTSNILERSLWMIFFVEVMGFVLTPQPLNIICLIVLWILVISVKATHFISNMLISATHKIEKGFLHSKYVLWFVALVDVVLVYFDSERLFTLLVMIILYCAIAQGVFYLVKDSRNLTKWAKYIFNLGVFIFFFSMILVYYIAFAILNVFLLPFWIYFWVAKRRRLPVRFIEIANGVMLVCLLVWYFK